VGALLFAAILTVPPLLRHRPEARPVRPVASEQRPSQDAVQKPAESTVSSKPKTSSETKPAVSEAAKSVDPAVPKTDHKAAPPVATESLKQTSEKEPPSPAVSSATSRIPQEVARPGTGGVSSAQGEVLDQVLPDVSEKARGTIHGKVRVSVKVHVDPSGGVTGAEFDSPGPSKFFADIALQAARKWAFAPPEVNGKSVPSEWRLRFEFTQRDTKVAPTQTSP